LPYVVGETTQETAGVTRRAAVFCALLLAGCAPTPAHPSNECSDDAVVKALAAQPAAAVIIVLRDVTAQDGVLRELGAEFEIRRRYQATPALAGNLTRTGFERARILDAVRCVQLDGTGSGL
jgi:hypothetical protein